MHAAASRRRPSRKSEIDERQASLEQHRQARLDTEDMEGGEGGVSEEDDDDVVVRQSSFRMPGAVHSACKMLRSCTRCGCLQC